MAENISPIPYFPGLESVAVDDDKAYEIYCYGKLIYQQEDLYFIEEPGTSRVLVIDQKMIDEFDDRHTEESAAPNQLAEERAVVEAGFATEPLRHSIAELTRYLYQRMLEDPIKGFTHGEWEAINRAHDLLGIERKHRGESA